LLYKLIQEKEQLMTAELAQAAEEGPRSINPLPRGEKRKAGDDVFIPKFRRGFAWGNSSSNISPSALYTETAPPLPRPPDHLLRDPLIQSSLQSLNEHIKVETPFDVDRLESLLVDHPNPVFVQSVLCGLREGFWPLDDGEWKIELKEVVDNYPSGDLDKEAIRQFRDKEQAAGRWSQEVSELLPGMKISPMFVIWRNEKPRVVTDHSGSGINAGIDRTDAKVRYDDMHDFGQCLHDARAANPGRRLVVFKDDVASAFLNLPAHPIWQLRQTVTVDGKLYIVRRLVFGNRASPRIWCALSGLLCWIGIRRFDIQGLYVYMDDFFGWEYEDQLEFYRGMLRPSRQVRLLRFWESVSCPFDDDKQKHGVELKIIGFWVNVQRGSISLAPSSIVDIIDKITRFLATSSRQPPLREWQRLAGHLNWLLNVMPWGRPALAEVYRKISGKTHSFRGVFINAAVRADLTWLAVTIPKSIGVRFVDSGVWDDSEADLVVWTDASLRGALSFVYGSDGYVYQLRECPSDIKIDIFFLELLAILSGIHHVASFASPPKRLLVYTDSLDSVGVLNSLRASTSLHNGPLLAIASVIMQSGIDLRARHIDGKKNIRADLLSRLLLQDFSLRFPSTRVRLFSPPRDLLPARWRECF
jgi:hypothetical protein